MSSPPRRPLRPSTVVLALGVVLAVAFGASGVSGSIRTDHDHSPISREVFFNIPDAMVAILYVTVVVLILAGAWAFSTRVQNWERGQPDRRETTVHNVRRRMEDLRAGLWMRTLVRDPAAGAMHSLIYFPFLILFAVTTVLEMALLR
jgi:uncharacterized protein HemY